MCNKGRSFSSFGIGDVSVVDINGFPPVCGFSPQEYGLSSRCLTFNDQVDNYAGWCSLWLRIPLERRICNFIYSFKWHELWMTCFQCRDQLGRLGESCKRQIGVGKARNRWSQRQFSRWALLHLDKKKDLGATQALGVGQHYENHSEPHPFSLNTINSPYQRQTKAHVLTVKTWREAVTETLFKTREGWLERGR